jgi:hypothetical protein
MKIDWINEITARGGYVATDELVKQMAAQYQITQAECKRLFEEFLSVAFSKGVGKEKTSEIFLSRWERYRMPVYKDSYISHVYVR